MKSKPLFFLLSIFPGLFLNDRGKREGRGGNGSAQLRGGGGDEGGRNAFNHRVSLVNMTAKAPPPTPGKEGRREKSVSERASKLPAFPLTFALPLSLRMSLSAGVG